MKLRYQERPLNIQNKIHEAFAHVKSSTTPWRDNGKDSYLLCEIDEVKLVQALIKSSPQQSIFRILDIGAGNFSFGNHLMKSLGTMPDINNEMKFEIFSVRGESVKQEEQVIKTSNCTHYCLGEFEIENLAEQFNTKGFNLINSVDLAVSSWTLRHLVDPVGTMLQIHECLKENQGMLLGDGFFMDVVDNRTPGEAPIYHKNLYKLLESFHNDGDSVMVYGNRDQHSLDNYILLKKSNVNNIPLQYSSLKAQNNNSAESKVMTSFKDLSVNADKDLLIKRIPNGFYFGSKELFDFIQNNKCQDDWYHKHFGESTRKDKIEDTYLGHSPFYEYNDEGMALPTADCNLAFCLGEHAQDHVAL